MSSIPTHLTRPFLFLIFLLLAALSLFALRPTYEPGASSIIGTPSRTIIQRAASTSTPTQTPTTSLSSATAVAMTTAAATDPVLANSTPTPTPRITPTLPPTPERIQEHIVQSGESIDIIALQYGLTAASITALNYLDEPDLLFPGQTLLIPRYANPTPPPELIESVITTALAQSSPGPAVLGYSTLNRPIELYTFGSGPNTLIFIGGIHGGYEWNSTVLAYDFIDYFTENPTAVPATITIHIIPAANPDGIFAVTGTSGPIAPSDVINPDSFQARFNANGVDLNRNWDCKWAPTAVWWDDIISGGNTPYSEVENQILLAFINSQAASLKGVIFWHSSAFLVSPGQCGDSPHQPSEAIASVYALAARYPVGAFDAYPITGEASNTLAQMGIPSFSVELSSHEAIDWVRNLAGVRALFALYEQR